MSQTPATARPISPLRRRMIEDMTVRGFGEKTQSDYIRHVKNFTIFLGRSPDLAEGEDLRLFQVRQREQGVQPPTMNGAVAALRFFFTTTCNRPEMARHLRLVKQPQKLPVILTQEEVLLLLEAAPGPKYKAALGVAYGAGLRVSEVSNLKVSDIDSERMVLRVEQGKGKCGPADDVAVPRARPAAADHDAPALSGGSRHGYGGRDREARVAAHAPAQLRHASSGAGCRYSRDPGGSGTFQARHDGALCPGREQGAARCDKPARSTHAAHPQEGRTEVAGGESGPSGSGGRGDLPRSRPCLASRQPGPPLPCADQGDERDRGLPHGGAGRACRALPEPGMWAHGHRLQFLR